VLDYTLVSATASYRLLTPRDVAAYVALVRAFYRECLPGVDMPPERVLATVRELEHNRTRGTVFVFERGESLVGYCILVNYWSNELGGNVLCVDELYVSPPHRGQGIGSDFLGLLAKVAPADTRGFQIEVRDGNRRALGFWRRLGFTEGKRRLLSRPITDPGAPA
jgi:ribosomal protein S18 acetylase RimI-like enzyme